MCISIAIVIVARTLCSVKLVPSMEALYLKNCAYLCVVLTAVANLKWEKENWK